MAGTELDWPVTVKASIKHCPADALALESGAARIKAVKSNLLSIHISVN